MSRFAVRIRPFVQAELTAVAECADRGDFATGFAHLERAHILGQASTREHVRVHWHMLLWAVRQRKPRDVTGQLFRLIGAATKTVIGLVPEGNTGGTNVSPFRRMPIPEDLAIMIWRAKDRGRNDSQSARKKPTLAHLFLVEKRLAGAIQHRAYFPGLRTLENDGFKIPD